MTNLIKIKDIASAYGISARTLRYYEDMGLIESVRRDDYAYRLYDEAAVKRLEQILILRRLNISIKDIKRVFSAPSSGLVLEVLSNKISDIDDEVALLHELKDVIMSFIQQIKDADFGNESDVKLLYEKARDIEAQLVGTGYDGNAANVNRLLEVTGKLEKRPDVVRKLPYFYNIFNVSNPIEAYALYRQAFGAEKVSEDYPGGEAHIGIEVNSFFILLRQEEAPVSAKFPSQGCCARLDSEEEVRRVYDLLGREGKKGEFLRDAGWTAAVAWVKDQYEITWMLCI